MKASVRKLLPISLVFTLVGAFALSTIRTGHHWGGDFSQYVHQTANMVAGIPYADTGYLYDVHAPMTGPRAYPPITSMLLVPVYAVRGLDIEAMKLVMFASFMVFLVAVYLSFRDQLSVIVALGLVVVLGVNYDVLDNISSINSDIPFMALVYLTVWWVRRTYRSSTGRDPSVGSLLAAGVTSYLAYGTRPLGIVLLPALLVHDALHRRRSSGRLRLSRAAMVCAVIFVGLAAVQASFGDDGRSYFDQLGDGASVYVRNWIHYVAQLGLFWDNGYLRVLVVPIFLVVSLLAALGYVREARQRITFCEVFPVLYLAVIFSWPGYQGMRYMLPIVPLYLFYALRGLQQPWFTERPRAHRAIAVCLALAITVSYAARATTVEAGPFARGPFRPTSTELFAYVRERTPADAVVIFIKPRVMALFADRRSSIYHLAADDAELWQYFGEIGATDVVTVTNDDAFEEGLMPWHRYLRDFVHRYPGRFVLEFENADFAVYHVVAADGRRAVATEVGVP